MITDFIKNTINEIFKAFPKIKECIYSFDKYSNTHFIKIDSIEIYNSEEFAKLDAEISIDFYNLGTEGSLCIISPESQTDLFNTESYINQNLLQESYVDAGMIYYNIIDSLVYVPTYNDFLLHNFFDESFKPDDSTFYPLAA
jgi:hypothetical protein